MSKVLKTAAIVVGAVALIASGVGAAGAAGLLGSTIAAGGTIAGIATAATLTTIGTIGALAAGLATVASGLTAKKPSAADATGSQTDFSANPDAGIPLAIGRTGTAGDINARFGFDTQDKGDNDRQAFVATLSLGPIAAIEGMTVDRNAVTYGPTGAAIGAFAGFMWSMTQLGAMPEAAALGFGAGAGTPPGWSAAHKISGKAAASWTMRFDTTAKLFQNGVPAPMWTVRGVLCYDPTKDSTYPGGSGPHRMADPANTAAYDAAMDTWEFTENPYLVGLRWAHGFWQRDRSNAASKYQRVMGMGANWSGIDVAAFVEGRNIALANGWKVGGMIYSADGKWDTMKKILQAGMGEPLALGARISCLVNAPKVSLATITIDDVIGAGSVAATQPRRARINTITPRYRLESNNWQLLPGAPITVATHVTEDRGKRSKVQDYPFIQQANQVATAVRYDIENAREFGPIILPLKLLWMGYKPGDCVTATLPELGLVAQPILLLNRELGAASGVVTMTARSETAEKHRFALGQTTTPPTTPGLSGTPLVPVPRDGSWAINASALTSDNATLPALVITGAVDAGTAEAIVFEYRPFVSGQAADAGWRTESVVQPGTTRVEIASVAAATSYEVAVSYRARETIGARRIIGPVTTSSVSTKEALAARAIADAAQASAGSAIADLADLANDGVLTPTEKIQKLIPRDAELEAAWALLDGQSALVTPVVSPNLASARAAAATARSAWRTYRDGLSPGWNNTTLDTAVLRATYNGRLTDYAYALTNLADALRQYANTSAQLALAMGDNTITNPNYEVDATGWNLVNMTRQAAPAGSPAVGSALFNVANGQSAQAYTQDKRPVSARRLHVSGWVNCGQPIVAIVGQWYNATSAAVQGYLNGPTNPPASGWQYISTWVDVPAGAARVDWFWQANNQTGSAQTGQVTAMRVSASEPGSTFGATSAQALAITDAQTKATAAIADLSDLANDGVLTPSEKIQKLIPRDAELDAAWSLLDGQAASVGGTVASAARTTAANARTAWQTYRNGLTPAWNNTGLDTAVTRATFNGKLNDYGYALTGLADALRATAQARANDAAATASDALSKANAAVADLSDLANDGVLTPAEKIQKLILRDAELDAAWSIVNGQATALNLPGTAKQAAADARTAWLTYRNSLSPAWNNTAADTAVVRATFNGKLNDYSFAISALVDALRQYAQQGVSIAMAMADNTIPNAGLATDARGWLLNGLSRVAATDATAPMPGSFLFNVVASGGAAQAYTEKQPVTSRRLHVSGWVKTGQPIVTIVGRWFDAISDTVRGLIPGPTNAAGSNAWQNIAAWVDVPADATRIDWYWQVSNSLAQPQTGQMTGMRVSASEPGATVGATAAQVAATTSAQNSANAALADLADLASDGVLTPTEKIQKLVPRDAELEAAWALLDAQASTTAALTSSTVSAARTALTTARSAWQTYRNALSPGWSNTSLDTAVVRTTFNGKLNDYAYAVTNLSNALRVFAGQTANWSGTSNDNGLRPADGATVDFRLTGSGSKIPFITANSAAGQPSSTGWDGFASPTNGIVGPVVFEGKVLNSGQVMLGLSTTSTATGGATATFSTLLLAVYRAGNNWLTFGSSNVRQNFGGAYNDETVWSVGFDGSSLFVAANGVVVDSLAYTTSAPLYGGIAIQANGGAKETSWTAYSDVTKLQPIVSRLNPATGRVVDPRMYNTQSILGPNNTTTLSPSYTTNASNVTVNLPAHSRIVAGPAGPITLSYGAGSGVVAFGAYWVAYIDDPNLTGIASPTVGFSSDASVLLYPGRYQVASGIAPAAGGTGGTVGSGGGGGSVDDCVCVDSFMPAGGLAGALEENGLIKVLDYDDWDRPTWTRATGNRLAWAECVRLVSASGITLVLSGKTPCTLRGGDVVDADRSTGSVLAVEDDDGFRWEPIIRVEPVGLRLVAHISCDDGTYAAGELPRRYIYTHNIRWKP